MRAAEWKRAARPLIPDDANWLFHGALCYRAPVGLFLFGVLGEDSGFDKGVYIWKVSMPLFVSADVIDLSYSKRIRPKKYDSLDVSEISTALSIGFRDLPSERDEMRRLVELSVGSPNLRLLEVAAQSQVLMNDRAGSLDTVRRAKGLPARFDWETDIVRRLSDLMSILEREGVQAAAHCAEEQSQRTAAALGLTHAQSRSP